MSDARLTETPGGVVLAPLGSIPDGSARNFVLQMRAGRFHGFVVRVGDRVSGWVDLCPHASLPLAQMLDDYLTPDRRHIVCSRHGALFDPASGACVGGPCLGRGLTEWPVEVVDDRIVTRGRNKPPGG